LGERFPVRRLGYAIGVFCVLILLVAYWEGARPFVSIVRFSPPNGFCAFDRTNKTDVEYFDGISNFARLAGFSVIAAYADCAELAESRKSGAFISTKVAFLRWTKSVDRPPSQFISDACDQVRKSDLSDEQKMRMSQYVTDFSNGKSNLKDVLSLGVLDEVKGTVCYPAKLMKGKIANTGDVTLVYLSAMTSLGSQPIWISQWTNFVDSTSIASALASMKTIYSDFAAINGKTN
jgi:hypothetical protein